MSSGLYTAALLASDCYGPTNTTAQACIKPATSTDIILVKDVTGEVHDLAYTYSGDRLATVRTPGTGTATGTTTYQYANGTPHQTSALTGTGTTNGVPGLPKTGDIGYDGSGRATSQPSQFTGPATNDYDTQGNLVRTASGGYTTTNAYDADGIRIARRTSIGAIQTTSVYLGDTEIFLTATNVKGSTHHFTTPGGTPLANTSSTGTPGWTWTMADAANTTRLTRDPTGAKRYNYYPYGEPTNLTTDKLPNPAITGSRGYLNKPHDIGGDLRLGHRTYTPNLNILTTPDPLLDPADPHSLNPYTYSRHNPTTNADPTGLVQTANSACDSCGGTQEGIDDWRESDEYRETLPEPPAPEEDSPLEVFGDVVGDVVNSPIALVSCNVIYGCTRSTQTPRTLAVGSYNFALRDYVECGKAPGASSECGYAAAGVLPVGKGLKFLTLFRRGERVADDGVSAANAGPDLSQGFDSFRAAQRSLPSPGQGNVYDHVVEQSQIAAGRSGFDPRLIHNPANLNPVPAAVNQAKANYYSSIRPFTGGRTVRDWLNGQSFEQQYSFGTDVTGLIQRGAPLP